LVTPNKQILTKGSFFLYHTATEGKNDDPLITIAAVLVVPYTYTTQKEVNVQVLENETFIFEQTIQIAQRNFVTEMIPLDQVNTELRLIEDPQKTKEAQDLWELLTTYSSTTIYEEGLFILPVTSQRRTSFFGDRRTYLYSNGSSDTSIHGGIDFGIPQGTPVVACANGRVVFAGPRIVTGMTIAIEHMPGVFSLYYHLKDISVHPDMIVSKGEQIGFSGATGLATGPHLHWEIRIHGEFADPDVFTKRLILNGAF
jgi:murein DD-endopeptidase MepM/ murein hydrolase activator NlpD